MNKLISIIMPVRNGENYIKEALDNILKQDMNIEIIIVNDGSTDKTVEIVKDYRCVIINKVQSEGQVTAKNDAIKIAKGEYVIFHDHDDVMRNGALKKLYDVIAKDETISAVEAKVEDFISPDLDKKEAEKAIRKIEPYYGLFTGAILMKKSVFDVIGKFNEVITTGEIIEWQRKMEKNNLKIEKVDFVAVNRRIHSKNYGSTHRQREYKDYATVLRADIVNSLRNR